MEVLGKVRERFPDVAVIDDDRVRRHRHRGRRGARRRVRFPRRSPSRAPTPMVARAREGRRAPPPRRSQTRQLEERLEQHERFGELIGTSCAHAGRLSLGARRRAHFVDGAHPRRERHGQGARRARHPPALDARATIRFASSTAAPSRRTSSRPSSSAASRGAFTGALDKPGLFELADKGTVFLDEIGDLPSSAQVKLLRALAQGEIRRVGSNETRIVDVRVARRDQRRSEGADRSRSIPRGPLLSPQRHPDPSAEARAAQRRHPARSPITSCRSTRGGPGAT